jgi:hypothetical protein
MAEACERVRVKPAISFRILPHMGFARGDEWRAVASRGEGPWHVGTRMVEKHYGHGGRCPRCRIGMTSG